MGGNIPGGNFLGGNFPGGIFQGGVWWVGIFRVEFLPGGIFLEPAEEINKQNIWAKQNKVMTYIILLDCSVMVLFYIYKCDQPFLSISMM